MQAERICYQWCQKLTYFNPVKDGYIGTLGVNWKKPLPKEKEIKF
jgi:hypothetical protein